MQTLHKSALRRFILHWRTKLCGTVSKPMNIFIVTLLILLRRSVQYNCVMYCSRSLLIMMRPPYVVRAGKYNNYYYNNIIILYRPCAAALSVTSYIVVHPRRQVSFSATVGNSFQVKNRASKLVIETPCTDQSEYSIYYNYTLTEYASGQLRGTV